MYICGLSVKMNNWISDLGRTVTGQCMTQVCACNPHVYMWIECMYVVCVCIYVDECQ